MIEFIKIEGFKSINRLEIKLKPINVFIGSNGSGKSNFISFFKLVNAIFHGQLQQYVIEDKTDNILYFGRKTTESMYGKIIFSEDSENNNAYWFILGQTKEGGLYIRKEASGYNVDIENDTYNYFSDSTLKESKIQKSNKFRDAYLKTYLENLRVFHFHDTSPTSLLRRTCEINDNLYLKSDGRNLPAFLYYLKINHNKVFNRLEKTIKSVAPFIEKLILEPNRLNEKEIELRWVEKGDLESSFSAYQFSDGTIRFIALATVLLQPEPPSVIIIDEPELGLHPQAISKLAGMIKSSSSKTQVIISTQSVNLVDCFEPENIIAVDRNISENQSIFNRLDPEKLKIWLEDHSLGELWERNIINSAQPFSK